MGWIGVDFDGTLAVYPNEEDDWPTPGKPVPLMLQRVKNWLAQGIEVRILTARVSEGGKYSPHRLLIDEWCVEHLGRRLTVTCSKDFDMIEAWDDRAVQVVPNTGYRIDGKDDPSEKI